MWTKLSVVFFCVDQGLAFLLADVSSAAGAKAKSRVEFAKRVFRAFGFFVSHNNDIASKHEQQFSPHLHEIAAMPLPIITAIYVQ